MSAIRNGTAGRGVLVGDLRCPTCSTPYELPLRPQRDRGDEEFVGGSFVGQRVVASHSPWFVECPRGHRWTVVTLYRAEGEPDALQLGEYIGNA